MRRRYSREQWLSWIREQQASTVTVSAFCRVNGVGENSFYRWRAKLIAEGEDLAESTPRITATRKAANRSTAPSTPTASSFVPLSVVQSPQTEIELPCGVIVRVPSDDDAMRCVLGVELRQRWNQRRQSRRLGRCGMLNLSGSVRIFVCTQPADMRRSFDGLCGMVRG